MSQIYPEEVFAMEDPDIEFILNQWKSELGNDFLPYRNHVYRVYNMAVFLSAAKGVERSKLAVAAAFHDLGIWSNGTWDYIQPSVERAAAYLAEKKHKNWVFDVSFMISEHHKLSRFKAAPSPLINAFRAADWLDVMLFLLPTRIPKAYRNELLVHFPRAGFHRRLLDMGLAWAVRHPFNPLPMFKF